MKIMRSVVRYQDGQNAQTLGQRLAWKLYINLIVAAVYMEGRANIVGGFLFDAFGV